MAWYQFLYFPLLWANCLIPLRIYLFCAKRLLYCNSLYTKSKSAKMYSRGYLIHSMFIRVSFNQSERNARTKQRNLRTESSCDAKLIHAWSRICKNILKNGDFLVYNKVWFLNAKVPWWFATRPHAKLDIYIATCPSVAKRSVVVRHKAITCAMYSLYVPRYNM